MSPATSVLAILRKLKPHTFRLSVTVFNPRLILRSSAIAGGVVDKSLQSKDLFDFLVENMQLLSELAEKDEIVVRQQLTDMFKKIADYGRQFMQRKVAIKGTDDPTRWIICYPRCCEISANGKDKDLHRFIKIV